MTEPYEMPTITLHHGDCLDVLRTLGDASVDAVVGLRRFDDLTFRAALREIA